MGDHGKWKVWHGDSSEARSPSVEVFWASDPPLSANISRRFHVAFQHNADSTGYIAA